METTSRLRRFSEAASLNPNYEIVDYDLSIEGIDSKFYNPTAQGLRKIAAHYKEKYGIDIEIFETNKDGLFNFMESNKEVLKKLPSTEEKKVFGFVLYNEGHTTSVAVIKHLGEDHIIIFDSINNNRFYEYVAQNFPDFIFLSNYSNDNSGRQSSKYGCRIDAISIMKDALRLEDFLEQVTSRIKIDDSECCGGAGKEASSTLLPETESFDFFDAKEELAERRLSRNFKLFRMPEELLKTCQRSSFLEGCEPYMSSRLATTKTSLTLEEKRAKHTHSSCSTGKEVNAYILEKSHRYHDLLLSHSDASDQRVAPSTTSKITSFSKLKRNQTLLDLQGLSSS